MGVEKKTGAKPSLNRRRSLCEIGGRRRAVIQNRSSPQRSKKVIEGENTIFGKFRELVESFEEIIPEENQRYHAAIKALSTTSKLSRQEIVKAVNIQLEELKPLEKSLMSALPAGATSLRP